MRNPVDPNDPAFNGLPGSGSPGLTKREYFVGLFVQGIVAGRYASAEVALINVDGMRIISEALELADDLIAELDK